MESNLSVKEILYQEIESISEQKIISDISKNSALIIDSIVSRCYPKILRLPGDKEENFGVFGESLMHYLLTNSLVPSQRKIASDKVELDIVIPSLKILNDNPVDTIVIIFSKSSNIKKIEVKIAEVKKVALESNIWVVSNSELSIGLKNYQINLKNNSFKNILIDITKFLSTRNLSKFKILKS